MSSSSGPPADAKNDDERRRITYSREFLLSLAGSEAAGRGNLDASVLRTMGWHWGVWERLYIKQWTSDEREELKPSQTSTGNKSKTCTTFSVKSHLCRSYGAGCRWGERCYFAHGDAELGKQIAPRSSFKTKLCGSFADGLCAFGGRCHYAHGEHELRSSAGCRFGEGCHSRDSGQQAVPKMSRSFAASAASPGMASPASFGASATAKISVDASLKGAIIGLGGASIKQIYRVTGAKLAIRDHDSDTSLKNIELKGTFDQIENASTMVMELIASIGDNDPSLAKKPARGSQHDGIPGSKYKTRLCEYFTRGFCSSGDGCCFAHGEDELRSPDPTDVHATQNFWAHDDFPSRKGGW